MNDFYCKHAEPYHRSTFHIDPASFLEPLCRHLPPRAHILDVGCGSGRDMLWLKRHGYEPMGLDRSPALAAIAARKTCCPVVVADFTSFDFSRFRMDAILLVGALVHVPPDSLEATLKNILPALRPHGHLLLSLKEGYGEQESVDGRIFFLWPPAELEKLLARCSLAPVEFFRQASLLRNGDAWLTYVLRRPE